MPLRDSNSHCDKWGPDLSTREAKNTEDSVFSQRLEVIADDPLPATANVWPYWRYR